MSEDFVEQTNNRLNKILEKKQEEIEQPSVQEEMLQEVEEQQPVEDVPSQIGESPVARQEDANVCTIKLSSEEVERLIVSLNSDESVKLAEAVARGQHLSNMKNQLIYWLDRQYANRRK